MAIKKLQNDFTTPEQSKRLLELGVPADSANCYLTRFGIDEDWEVKVLNNNKYCELEISNQDYCLPCWSVGRLMEIYDMCFKYPKSRSCWCSYIRNKGVLFVNYVLDCYEKAVYDKLLDFSKLEE